MVDCSFVGAGLAAKLLFAPITLVDKRTLFVKSTSVADLFVPEGTPTREVWHLQELPVTGAVQLRTFILVDKWTLVVKSTSAVD
jgi:hypothetical protein